MNPQNNSELPPIYTGEPEQQTSTEQFTPVYEQTAEQVNAQAIERGVSTPAAGPSPGATTAGTAPQPASTPQLGGSTPQIADDLDLIEKEWVEKAKAIVQHTKHDPRSQSQEMNRFKADYLKQRFNKDIKLEEA